MARERIRIGIIGCGRIADLQCLGYLEHPRAEIAAVCDVDEALARRRAAAWGEPRVYTDLSLLLADPEIDAVEILTPHHLHADHATAALRAGKHVSLQKPPTRTLAEFDRITRISEEAGLTFRTFENFGVLPAAPEGPRAGGGRRGRGTALGAPQDGRGAGPTTGWEVTPQSQAWRLDTATCGGGPTTFDHGYHCFNMGRYFMPVEVERVHAFVHWTELAPDVRIDGPGSSPGSTRATFHATAPGK